MTVPFAALMCHAPIVIPAVGGDEATRCRRTTRAMREVAQRAVSHDPDRLVLVSPHTPRLRRSFAALAHGPRGDLGAFRAARARVDLPAAPEVAEALGLPRLPDDTTLDHGATVPLWFLGEAGWSGPTAVIALPWEEGGASTLGRSLAALPGRTVVIASGDMSHRLRPGAPAGHHPDAPRFDAAFVKALRARDWVAALHAPHQDVAAEDVVASTAVAMAAAGAPHHAEVLSYEGPWGVGYTVAILRDDAPPLYALARAAVRAAVRGEAWTPPPGGPGPAGVFVTLHAHGELRGCIGHVAPVTDRLYAELAQVAPAAALHDPRFPPVRPDELDGLEVEVSVLEPPERITGPQQLDPRAFGVVVEAHGRRGLLLPDLHGVDTPSQQIAIATRKAGLPEGSDVRLSRFRVHREAPP